MKVTRRKSSIAAAVMGTMMIMGGAVMPAAAESNVRSVSRHAPHHDRHVHGDACKAGILVVEGRQFTIYHDESIGHQIVRIMRRCGYDASIERGRVVICYDYYRSPSVRWYARGYRASIYKSRGTMTISWKKNGRGHQSSIRNSWGWSSDHGWGHKKRYPSRRQRRCD